MMLYVRELDHFIDFYAIHSTLATAALFLLVDVVRERRERNLLTFDLAPPIAGGALVAGMFFAAAIAMAGLPPLSGFIGKLLILDAAMSDARMAWVWAIVLGMSLIAVIGFARAGSTIFWKAHASEAAYDEGPPPADEQTLQPLPALPMVAIGGILATLVAVTVFAGPLQRHLTATAEQLFAPGPYISTVLETPGKEISYKGHGEDDHGEESKARDSHDADDSHGDAQEEEGH